MHKSSIPHDMHAVHPQDCTWLMLPSPPAAMMVSTSPLSTASWTNRSVQSLSYVTLTETLCPSSLQPRNSAYGADNHKVAARTAQSPPDAFDCRSKAFIPALLAVHKHIQVF